MPLLRYAPRMNHFLDPPHVYQLRVVLWGTSPLIWRRILVHSDASLATLHEVLQILFAWSDEHLHCFRLGYVGKGYSSRSAGLPPHLYALTGTVRPARDPIGRRVERGRGQR